MPLAFPGRLQVQVPSKELGHRDLLTYIFAALSTVVSQGLGHAMVAVFGSMSAVRKY